MSYARNLSDILKEKNPTLHSRLKEIEKLASPLLAYTAGSFPYYTPHGFDHSRQVEENLNWLIPDHIKPKLSDWEIFFMIIAAWMHDWGMVSQSGEEPENVRKTHHVRTEKYFETLYDKLKLDKHEALIVGRISRGHRVEDVRGQLFEPQIFSNNYHIDVRFLTAIVRIADECDITHNRVPELIYYSLNPQGVNEEHFKNHLSIGGIGKDGEHKIKFYGVAYDPKGSQTLKKLRDKLQKEVDHVKGILAEKQIPIEYVEAHIDARGFIDKPISFKLDERKVTDILIGSSIYSRQDVSIRELLQNSVDACRLRKTKNPSMEVKIRIYKDGEQLVIEDNGVGMDYETASTFLSNKGFSYYTSEEFNKLKDTIDFDPISRWGLGILSCFLIAKDLKIETKYENKDSCKFLISDVGEGWRYENSEKCDLGTKITLTLNDFGSKIDLEKAIRYYIKSSSVPIYLGKDINTSLSFDWTIADPFIQSSLRMFSMISLPKFNSPIEYEDDEIWARYYEADSHTPYSTFIANQGFFVRDFPVTLPTPRMAIIIVNTKKDILELDISRDELKTNSEKFNIFAKKWISLIFYFIEKQLEVMYKKSYPSIASKFHILNRELSQYNIFNTISVFPRKSKIQLNDFPSYIRSFLHEFKFSLILTKNEFEFISLKEIVTMKPNKIYIYHPNTHYSYSHRAPITEKYAKELLFVESGIKNKLSSNDIILIMPEINSLSLSQKDYSWEELLPQIMANDVKVEEISIQDIVNEQLEHVTSPLDPLLPKNSHFAKFPSELACSVICNLPFTIELDDAVAFPSYDILSHFLDIEKTEGLKIIKEGTFAFDIKDEFVQLLLTKEKDIMQSEILKIMVKNYLLLLLLKFYGSMHFPFDSFLQFRENEILSTLNQTNKIMPFTSRQGVINFILRAGHPANHWTNNIKKGVVEIDDD